MAALATYTGGVQSVQFGATKYMAGIFNAHATLLLKCWRVWTINSGVAAITGLLCTMQLKRSTARTAGTAGAWVKHDSNNGAVDANITVNYNDTGVTATDILRSWIWSSDEPSASTGTSDEWECLPALCCIWDAGYGDTNVQPLTFRQNQGLEVYNTSATAAGYLDTYFECTIE